MSAAPTAMPDDLPGLVAGMSEAERRKWNRERVLVDDAKAEGAPIYDDEGREVGRGYPIRTQHVAPKPPPPDHPALRDMLLAPASSPLLVARDLDHALRLTTRG